MAAARHLCYLLQNVVLQLRKGQLKEQFSICALIDCRQWIDDTIGNKLLPQQRVHGLIGYDFAVETSIIP
jgi:hypothetical protein